MKAEFVRSLGGGEGGGRFFGSMGRTLRAALWSMFLKQRLAMLVGFVKPGPLQALADILGQPGVTPAVDRSFPLEEAAERGAARHGTEKGVCVRSPDSGRTIASARQGADPSTP